MLALTRAVTSSMNGPAEYQPMMEMRLWRTSSSIRVLGGIDEWTNDSFSMRRFHFLAGRKWLNPRTRFRTGKMLLDRAACGRARMVSAFRIHSRGDRPNKLKQMRP